MITINVNDAHSFTLAEKWNELTGRQLIKIAPYILQPQVSLQQRSFVAYVLCGFGNKFFKSAHSRKYNGYLYFANEIVDKVVPLTDFLYNDIKLTKQILPLIEVPGRFKFFGTTQLHGPSDNFNNLTLAEFADAEYWLNKFADTKQDIYFDRFIATLYRPAKRKLDVHSPEFNGDYRQAYNNHLTELIAAMVTKVDTAVKAAILVWYRGCRAEIVANNRWLFPKGGDKDKPGSGTWADVVHGLAGPKFGTVDETEKVFLKVILLEMKILHEQVEQNKP